MSSFVDRLSPSIDNAMVFGTDASTHPGFFMLTRNPKLYNDATACSAALMPRPKDTSKPLPGR
jgi:hypothetical protein